MPCACTATGLLDPIERTEGEYGGELLRSLEAFIENNGNWERAARQLYCHRHTLRYRIRKIEELTGRDLAGPRTGSSSGWRCGQGSWSDDGHVRRPRRPRSASASEPPSCSPSSSAAAVGSR